jgi:2-C-methyl-D-erythritol 4-phosphate cytidylyltransferase
MVAAIIVAAGKGRRMGGDIPKQYLALGREPVIARTLRVFDACPLVDALVWVAPEADLDYCRREILASLNTAKTVLLTAGGERRQASVYKGLLRAAELLQSPSDLVAIHDGVRPLVTIEQINACIRAARSSGACILGLPVVDTLKQVDDGGRIIGTSPRKGMWHAQTPQVFRHDLILSAHEQARRRGIDGTDDAQLMEDREVPVSILAGSRNNIKITTSEDLDLARVLVGSGLVG